MQHPLSFLHRELDSDAWKRDVETAFHDVVIASQYLIHKNYEPASRLSLAMCESGNAELEFYGAMLMQQMSSMQAHYAESEDWLTIAGGLLTEGDRVANAHLLYRTGMLHAQKGQLRESLEVQTKAQQLFDELGLELESALARSSIGYSLLVMGDAAGAVDTLLQAFPVIERDAPISHSNALRANVASALQRVGNQELARSMYLEALVLPPFTHQGNSRATVLHNLAIIEKETGRVEEALLYYDLAMETAMIANLPERRVRLAAGKAELLTRYRRTDEAIALIEGISNEDLSVSSAIAAFDVYAVRSRIHTALGELDASLH